MTKTDDRILALIDAYIEMRRLHCRTVARLGAMEVVIFEMFDESEHASLRERLKTLEAEILERILLQVEDRSPSVAVELDDRRPDEMP